MPTCLSFLERVLVQRNTCSSDIEQFITSFYDGMTWKQAACWPFGSSIQDLHRLQPAALPCSSTEGPFSARCNTSSFPLLPSLPLQEGLKGKEALKSIHKNMFNCYWIPCGSPQMDKGWEGKAAQEREAEQINRLRKMQVERAWQGTHSS